MCPDRSAGTSRSRSGEAPGRDAARAAKQLLSDRLADDRRVNGIGITRWHGAYAVRVNVVDGADQPELPEVVEGVPVRVVVIGRVVTSPD